MYSMLIIPAIYLYRNHINDQRRLARTVLDTSAIYEGVLHPMTIIFGVIQILNSNLGWALILPNYQVLVSMCWYRH